MEKIDNNKTEYKYIEQPIYLSNLKTNQIRDYPCTKKSQINHSKGRDTYKERSSPLPYKEGIRRSTYKEGIRRDIDCLSSTYLFKRFYNSDPAFPVKTVEKKTLKYPLKGYKEGTRQDLVKAHFLALQQQEKGYKEYKGYKGYKGYGEGKAFMQLQELKKKFINILMRNGEKPKASKLFYESLKQVEDKSRQGLVKKTMQKQGDEGYEEGTRYEERTRYEEGPRYKGYEEVPLHRRNLYDTELFDFFAARKKQERDTIRGLYTDQKKEQQEGIPREGLLRIPSYHTRERIRGLSRDTIQGGNKDLFQYFYTEFLRLNILYQAVENVKPTLELRRVRKGGTTYQVPAIVSQKRQERVAIKWIIESAEKRKKRDTKSNHSFSDCLVSEILDAFNKTGQPRQRRDEQLKVAEYNRAYTRYRWW